MGLDKDLKARKRPLLGGLSRLGTPADESLLAAIPDPLFVFDAHGRALRANASALDLFGRPGVHGDFLIGELVADSEREDFLSHIATLDMGDTCALELDCCRATGVVFSAEVKVSRAYIGTRERYVVGVRNTTSHRMAVRSLRDSEELTHTLLASSLDAFVTMDERGLIREFNPAAERMFGYERHEVIGRPLADVMIPEDRREMHAAGLARYVEDGAPRLIGKRIEMEARRRDGKTFPVELRMTEVQGASTRLFAAYLSDISERVDAWNALGAERDKLEAILSATHDGILLVDHHGYVRYANASFAGFFGLTIGALENARIDQLAARLRDTSPDPADVFDKLLVSPDSGGDATEFALACRVNAPEARSLFIARRPILSTRLGAGSWLAIVRDTSREEEIRRAQDAMVGSVSHELRTPLTAIGGFIQLLRDERTGELTDQQSQFIDIIGDNVSRLMQLVADLLDIEGVRDTELSIDDIELRFLLDEVCDAVAGKAAANRIVFDNTVSPGTMIRGDRERLAQVFGQIVSNAIRFSSDAPVAIGARDTGDGAMAITIRDQGCGISAEERGYVFERFFRGADPAVRANAGTGLGLSIAKGLVERHGGTIEISSEIGEGTAVTVTLPHDVVERPVQPKVSDGFETVGDSTEACRVLVVEDDVSVREVLAAGLMLEGHAVRACATAEEALSHVELGVDVVMLDITLPDMDGWELLDRISPLGFKTIVCSGHDCGERALAAGADAFFMKPVDVFAVSEWIAQHGKGQGAGTCAAASPEAGA